MSAAGETTEKRKKYEWPECEPVVGVVRHVSAAVVDSMAVSRNSLSVVIILLH